MAVIMALNGYYYNNIKLGNQRRAPHNLSFPGSISVHKLPKNRRSKSYKSGNDKFPRFLVEMRQTELPPSKYGTNGRAVKMVPANEVVKRKTMSENKVEMARGSKQAVNGASLVERDPSLALTKTKKSTTSKELPPLEELKVLPSDEGFSWANENYNSLQRSIDVWSFVISLRIRVLLDNAKWAYLGDFTEEKQKSRRRKTAAWLRECVLQLGPTFIKLGQLSSTRSDLFPREFVEELAKLQDRVPAFSPKKARGFIESELGAPINILFKEFEDRPIAAASLGQLAFEGGFPKCLGAYQFISEPSTMSLSCKQAAQVVMPALLCSPGISQRASAQPAHVGTRAVECVGMLGSNCKILYQEIDYINEGKNADRFRRDFRNIKWVRVPLVYWDYTASKVLTLEYAPGIKINEVDMLASRGYDRLRISSHTIEAYLIQILRTGFFHADPHPGNLAVDVDEAIIYYDFGMMGEIKSFTRERLLELFYAVYEKDAKKVMQCLIDLGALQPTGDLSSVRRSIQFFLDNLLSQTPDQQQTLSAIGEDLFAIAQDQPFRFPSTFTFVIRAFSTLEGQSRLPFLMCM
ncbi:hypothetical protein JHK84_035356 [Glycine max]|nr:hypothetical protein JHK84_035356 [Glycine max]